MIFLLIVSFILILSPVETTRILGILLLIGTIIIWLIKPAKGTQAERNKSKVKVNLYNMYRLEADADYLIGKEPELLARQEILACDLKKRGLLSVYGQPLYSKCNTDKKKTLLAEYCAISDVLKAHSEDTIEKHASGHLREDPQVDAAHDSAILDKIIVLDTETTGLNHYNDELLQVSIIDGYGNVLFNEYIKPRHHKCWDEAERINNISPQMVRRKKHIDAYNDQIESILRGKVIVGYNASFDLDFLNAANIGNSFTPSQKVIDVMKVFAKVYGEWSPKYKDYKFQKLTTCAAYYGYKWSATAHDALADCKATLYCFKEMLRACGNIEA